MHKQISVTIILPALLPTPDFHRAISSVRAAMEGRLEYELICVVRAIEKFAACAGDDMRVVQESEPGIYGAMNSALPLARGRFLYFMGQDDILLPAVCDAIFQGIDQQADLILANVFWGSTCVYENKASRHALVWKNWCHQGLIYDRLKFNQRVARYPLKFKSQADHYANIVFCSESRVTVTKYQGCIAWYAADGYSVQVRDEIFRAEFPALVRKHYGYISWLMVAIRRIILKFWKSLRSSIH